MSTRLELNEEARELLSNHTLQTTQDFALAVGIVPVGPIAGSLGYLLVNRRTLVTEAAGVDLALAIRALHLFQRALDAVRSDPEGLSEEPLAGRPPSFLAH